jgi:hypothetical protein
LRLGLVSPSNYLKKYIERVVVDIRDTIYYRSVKFRYSDVFADRQQVIETLDIYNTYNSIDELHISFSHIDLDIFQSYEGLGIIVLFSMILVVFLSITSTLNRQARLIGYTLYK